MALHTKETNKFTGSDRTTSLVANTSIKPHTRVISMFRVQLLLGLKPLDSKIFHQRKFWLIKKCCQYFNNIYIDVYLFYLENAFLNSEQSDDVQFLKTKKSGSISLLGILQHSQSCFNCFLFRSDFKSPSSISSGCVNAQSFVKFLFIDLFVFVVVKKEF